MCIQKYISRLFLSSVGRALRCPVGYAGYASCATHQVMSETIVSNLLEVPIVFMGLNALLAIYSWDLLVKRIEYNLQFHRCFW